MSKFRKGLLALLLFSCGTVGAQKISLVDYVNTLQGTNSHWGLSYGNTYPTIAVPFPVHSWSPQTGRNGDGWKYTYNAKTIRGFQQVHQCSPWMGDYAVFSLMPVTGKLEVGEEARASAFSHDGEIAKPHYYKVALGNGTTTEIAPAERAGHMRFSFPKGKDAFLVLDGYTKTSGVTIHPKERKITGWVHNGTFIPKEFRCYFEMQFDQPFVAYGTWENRKNTTTANSLSDSGEGKGAYLQFKPGTVVQVKIASSYISPQQASLTLQQELGKFKTVQQTSEAAKKEWNTLFARVVVEGGSEEDMATFYSCLFRANLFSHKFYEIDKDGNPYYFSPYDSKIHPGYMYTDNGFWDTFRAQFPLSNILHPTMQGRYMQSLLDAQEQSGFFPTWSNPGASGVMIGNHAISLLTDAWAKGIRNFDPEKVLKAYLHEISNKGPWGGSNGREAHQDYFSLGYVPYPKWHESTAKTLEFAYDDFCAFQLARMTGNRFYEKVFARQMYNYKNIFDTTVGFVRGRMGDGSWLPNFDPIEWGGPFTEANAWQYSWSIFHNVEDLKRMMGGEKAFLAKLDSFFSMHSEFKVGTYRQTIHEMREMVLARMGQYAHGNQPVQHAAYLYNYTSQPWKAQKQVREVMDRLYNATENGYPGDEDQGGMSSWYVLSALGIYSVCPGTDEYVLGSPKFGKATIILENGKQFVVEAVNNSKQNVYIQSATLNGVPYDKNFITYNDIINGGTLRLVMGSRPATNRGIGPQARPFSLATHLNNIAATQLNEGSRAVRLPAVLADSMVLQQQTEAPVWGWTLPGETINVKGSWGASATAIADKDGKWMTKLKTPKAGGPFTVTISGKETIELKGVLIGEVWLASGQSNMEMPVAGWNNEPIEHSAAEIKSAMYPGIRMFTVAKNMALEPQQDVTGSWSSATPHAVPHFSATAYFFAKELHQRLGVPVGILHSSWGGTVAEAWTSNQQLRTLNDFDRELNRLDSLRPHIAQMKEDDERKQKAWQQQLASSRADFAKVIIDVSGWREMILPAKWETAGMPDVDGIVWFRKEITIPAAWKGKDLKLDLGPIDDLDVTWFNGKQVGNTDGDGSWFVNRSYTVPGEWVNEGRNWIAVKVTDQQGDGGIYGDKSLLKIYPVSAPGEAINLAGTWLYKLDVVKPTPSVRANPNQPSVLFHAMIAPLVPYAIKGAIWYQGESNVGRAAQYEKLFPVMISDWRAQWQRGEFSFYFVQIAPFAYWGDSTQAAALRDAQRRSLSLSNTGMAVTLDVGSLQTIHPAKKQDVGQRLAHWALAKDYGQAGIVYSGPLYKGMQVLGNKITVSFDHTDGGLELKNKKETGFEIAGADGKFVPAKASVQGAQVVVYADGVDKPTAVRYAWSAKAFATLFNKKGLPASSFTSQPLN